MPTKDFDDKVANVISNQKLLKQTDKQPNNKQIKKI